MAKYFLVKYSCLDDIGIHKTNCYQEVFETINFLKPDIRVENIVSCKHVLKGF